MFGMFKKHLLATTAVFAPPNEGDGAPGPDNEEDRIEVDLDDDDGDQSLDPIDEQDEGEGDDDDPDGDDDRQAGDGDPEPRTRGDRQVAALRADRRRLADENARITRELAELRNRPAPQHQQVTETPQQRAERMALLSPEERIQETVSAALAENERKTNILTNQLLDASDRSSFDVLCSSNPLLKKLAPEVERRRQELLQRDGQLVSRSVVATYLIGEKALAQAGKKKPGAEQRRRQQEVRPRNSGGDVQADRGGRRSGGDTAADMERRFGDVPI